MNPFQNSAQAPASDRDSEIVKDWINFAADLVTVPVGAVLGFFAGGPAGAGAGAATGVAASHGLRAAALELWARHMSDREKRRVAAVVLMAGKKMQDRLLAGDQLREDDFFKDRGPYRSDAVEVTDSLLLKAQREPEERKLPYIANLIASIAFDSAIDVAMAHQLLRFASDLSFRQYCILALATRAKSFDLFQDHASSIGRENLSGAQTSFLSDCWDLKVKGLLWTGTDLDLSLYEIRPGYLSLLPLGVTLAGALGLESIPSQNISPLADLFTYGRGNVPPKTAP